MNECRISELQNACLLFVDLPDCPLVQSDRFHTSPKSAASDRTLIKLTASIATAIETSGEPKLESRSWVDIDHIEHLDGIQPDSPWMR